jgi:ACS family hexuronate transporter-like MFS transporter
MPLGMIIYSASIYLHTKFGWDQATLGKVLWIPPLGWELSYFVFGTLVDKHGARYKGLMLTSLLLTLPLAWTDSLPSGAWVLAVFFVAMFAVAGFVFLSVSWASRAFSKEHTGLISGIGAGSWSAVVAISSSLLGRLFDQAQYEFAFRAAVACSVCGYLLWRFWSVRSTLSPANLVKANS